MRLCAFFLVAAALRLSCVLAADFSRALDLIVQHHGEDKGGLASTLDTLTQIVTKLKDAPDERKYRSIRLLNKSFWARVGSINGGISFMTALGFELVEQQGDRGPSFEVRSGAPDQADLARALNQLHRRAASKDSGGHDQGKLAKETTQSAVPESETREGFDPFATAFSRKSRTNIQARAEQGLAHMTERQAQLQQRFETNDERNLTIMLPGPASPAGGASSEQPGEADGGHVGPDQAELEMVMRLWRDRHANPGEERFETAATRKLRLLRASKAYPYVLLRVRLPKGLYMQARFNLDETLETVYQVFTEGLRAEAAALAQALPQAFELFSAAPTRVLPRGQGSLREADVHAPACLLHLRWDHSEADAADRGSDLEAAMEAAADTGHARVAFSSRYDVPEPVAW